MYIFKCRDSAPQEITKQRRANLDIDRKKYGKRAEEENKRCQEKRINTGRDKDLAPWSVSAYEKGRGSSHGGPRACTQTTITIISLSFLQ